MRAYKVDEVDIQHLFEWLYINLINLINLINP